MTFNRIRKDISKGAVKKSRLHVDLNKTRCFHERNISLIYEKGMNNSTLSR